jgi:hypothetical protein
LHITSKTIITLILKKRGYKKGITDYTNRNIKAMLDNVEFIFLIIDNEWNFILKHYSKTYSSQTNNEE